MSKTLLDDKDHRIATEGAGSDDGNDGLVVRLSLKYPYITEHGKNGQNAVTPYNTTVPLDKLRTALRRAGTRRSWDEHFLDRAAHIAGQSKDPSTKVGACIVDTYRRQIADGYNGFPRGVEDSEARLHDRDIKYPLTIHAELNAILFARQDLNNCTIYVWPSPPCTRCAAAIIQVGIVRVVTPPASKDILSRWQAELTLAAEVLHEAGLTVDTIGAAVEP